MNLTHHHVLKPSPWPIKASFGGFSLAIGYISWIHGYQWGGTLALLGLIYIIWIFNLWTRDILRESLHLGLHTENAKNGATNGFILFMVSEIFFFGGFIWSYLYTALAPSIHFGAIWPPIGIEAVAPNSIPLLNTVILLTSAATATWAHNAVLAGVQEDAWVGLLLTVLLGAVFSALQGIEYFQAPYTFTDSCYGSVFFATVSLHGLHVIVGALFLWICKQRIQKQTFTANHHISLECALIMWHIVDVIWLIVFTIYYAWAY